MFNGSRSNKQIYIPVTTFHLDPEKQEILSYVKEDLKPTAIQTMAKLCKNHEEELQTAIEELRVSRPKSWFQFFNFK